MVKRNYGGVSYPWQLQPTALVAAEDSQTRKYVAEALSRAGYTADVYSDAQGMLKDLSTAGYSFLILQGGQAGLDVVSQIRKRDSDFPVIALSGGPHEEECSLSLGAGSVQRLSTPFTLETLQFAIAKVIRTYELGEGGRGNFGRSD